METRASAIAYARPAPGFRQARRDDLIGGAPLMPRLKEKRLAKFLPIAETPHLVWFRVHLIVITDTNISLAF